MSYAFKIHQQLLAFSIPCNFLSCHILKFRIYYNSELMLKQCFRHPVKLLGLQGFYLLHRTTQNENVLYFPGKIRTHDSVIWAVLDSARFRLYSHFDQRCITLAIQTASLNKLPTRPVSPTSS